MNKGIVFFLVLGIVICIVSFLFLFKILSSNYLLKFFLGISFFILIYTLLRILLDFLKKK
jgi:hypothetical protein